MGLEDDEHFPIGCNLMAIWANFHDLWLFVPRSVDSSFVWFFFEAMIRLCFLSYYYVLYKLKLFVNVHLHPKKRIAKATDNKWALFPKGKKLVSQAPWLWGGFAFSFRKGMFLFVTVASSQPTNTNQPTLRVSGCEGGGESHWVRRGVNYIMGKKPAPSWYLHNQWRHHGTSSAQKNRAPKLKVTLYLFWITIFSIG